MTWVLITGGVCSGIGKGCVAAMLARLAARSGLRVGYQKFETCLQSELAGLPNTHFGELVCNADGHVFDGDVARAAFYVPGFRPGATADVSLGHLLRETLDAASGEPSPRLTLSAGLQARIPTVELLVVELGGTAGELEHGILSDALRRAWGQPTMHVHVSTLVTAHAGRVTTKPAQCSLAALTIPPDLLFLRGSADTDARETLARTLGHHIPLELLSDDPAWPERAALRAWRSPGASQVLHRTLGIEPAMDPLFDSPPINGEPPEILVVDDGAGHEGYASLLHRLRAWSKGHVQIRLDPAPRTFSGVCGVVRIGERSPASVEAPPSMPTLSIAPTERGYSPRHYAMRPDWHGSAELPAGELVAFLAEVQAAASSTTPAVELAYAVPDFARQYLAASRQGALRDHAWLDQLVARALPTGERLAEARILDIGCGGGRWAERLILGGAREIVGVEPAPPMAAAARELDLPRFRLIESSIESYHPEGRFDAVLASMSLDHVEALDPVLRRMATHLAPHGRLIITTEHPLRTAARDGLRWIEEAVGTRAARVRDYGVEGWRSYTWFSHPAPVRVYHRSFETWFSLLRHVGLQPIALHEPTSDALRDALNPRFWLIVAERPGPKRSVVTIDGPAASGKSTLGCALARRLGWICVDSGLIQRTFAWRHLHDQHNTAISFANEDGALRCLVGARDVTDELGDEVVARACIAVSKDSDARAEMDAALAALIRERCVLVGRSWGRSIVDVLARFALDAPSEVRARRRGCSEDEILARDDADHRQGRSPDPDITAVVLDTSRHEIPELVALAESHVRVQLGLDP